MNAEATSANIVRTSAKELRKKNYARIGRRSGQIVVTSMPTAETSTRMFVTDAVISGTTVMIGVKLGEIDSVAPCVFSIARVSNRGSSPTSGVPNRAARLGWGGEGGLSTAATKAPHLQKISVTDVSTGGAKSG